MSATDFMSVGRFPDPRRGAGAFTFIELLIIVTIVAILAMLAVPLFRDTDATRLRAAGNLVMADLAYVQAESITHADDPRMLCVAADGLSYWIAASSNPNTPLTNPHDKQPYRVVFGQGRAHALTGVRLSAHNFGSDNRVLFDAFGQLDQATDGILTLSAGSYSLTLQIHRETGEASVAKQP